MDVSVVIAVYNDEKRIGRAIHSARKQGDVEILVIDDGSTDGTARIVRYMARHDARIRLFSTGVNRGPGYARNVGLRAATGSWVAILDSDDAFSDGRLEKLVAFGEEKGASLVCDDLLLINGSHREPMLGWTEPRQLDLEQFVQGNNKGSYARRESYGYMHPVFRTAFLREFNLEYQPTYWAEDFMLTCSCLSRGGTLWVYPEPLYEYSVRKGSLVEQRAREEDVEAIKQFDREIYAQTKARAIRKHLRKLERSSAYRGFVDAIKAQKWVTATRLFLSKDMLKIGRESTEQVPRFIYRRVMRKDWWGRPLAASE